MIIETLMRSTNKTMSMLKNILINLLMLCSLSSCNRGNPDCENLYNIANSSIHLKVIDDWIRKLRTNPELLRNVNKSRYTVFVRDLKGDVGIDWRQFNIPLDILTFEFYGKDIDYMNFNLDEVKSLSIGYGHRKHLIYKMKGAPDFGVDGLSNFENAITKVSDDITVVCR